MKKLFSIIPVAITGALILAGCAFTGTPTTNTPEPSVSVIQPTQPTEPTNILIGEYEWNGLEISMIQTAYGYATKKQLANWRLLPETDLTVENSLDIDFSERVLSVKFIATNNTDKELLLIGIGLGNTRWFVEDLPDEMINNNIWLPDNNSESLHEILGLSTLPADGWLLPPNATKELNLDIYVPAAIADYGASMPENKVKIINIFSLPIGDEANNDEFSPEFEGYVYLK